MYNADPAAHTAVQTTKGVDLVQSYLDSLLRDVSADVEVEVEVDVEVEVEVDSARQTTIESAPPAPPDIADDTGSTITAVVGEEEESLLLPELDPHTERVVPAWAQQGFAGLLFEVSGLKMAAPLHALGGITLIEDRLQPLVGQADWLMGLLRWNGRNLRVIDTARFVMPERLHGTSHHAGYQNVVVLGDSHWALAVDCADESVSLSAADIRWKGLVGSRPWLAGTLLNRLCALLDVDNLMRLLQQHEQQVRDAVFEQHPG